LERSKALPADQIAAVRKAVENADRGSSLNPAELGKLQGFARSLSQTAKTTNSAVDAKRMQALADILQKPSK
jgi:hypothetical protein